MDTQGRVLERRRFLAYFSGAGLTATLFPGVLWARLQEEEASRVTAEMVRGAEQLSGLEFTPEEREEMVRAVNQNLEWYEGMRAKPLVNGNWPALQFNPALPGMRFDQERRPFLRSDPGPVRAPANLEEAAFWPVMRLARLLGSSPISIARSSSCWAIAIMPCCAHMRTAKTLPKCSWRSWQHQAFMTKPFAC